jgi:hypothetical protein
MVELGARQISCYREVHGDHLFSADQKSSSGPIGNGGGSCCSLRLQLKDHPPQATRQQCHPRSPHSRLNLVSIDGKHKRAGVFEDTVNSGPIDHSYLNFQMIRNPVLDLGTFHVQHVHLMLGLEDKIDRSVGTFQPSLSFQKSGLSYSMPSSTISLVHGVYVIQLTVDRVHPRVPMSTTCSVQAT